MAKQKTIVAIYTRVSTREQAEEGYSLDSQARILLDLCELKHYNVFKIYSDEGISGKDARNRPAFMEMINDSRNAKFEKILIWRLDRFSRNICDTLNFCEELSKYSVTLESYTETFDSSTPSGRMTRNIISSVAQYQREIISENVYMGLLERARQGKRTCHDILGYDLLGPDSFSINPTEAEYVNFVHDQYMIRKNITEVALLAKEKGFRGKRGRIPHINSVSVILTRPEYAGYNVFHGELYKGDYEPIRTPASFNRVQRLILRQGKIMGRQRVHPLYIVPE